MAETFIGLKLAIVIGIIVVIVSSVTGAVILLRPRPSTTTTTTTSLTTTSGTTTSSTTSSGTTTSSVSPPGSPSATFTFWPNVASTGDTVNFYALASYDTDGTITNYSWDFGDEGTATGAIVAHEFSSIGNHLVTLTVTDDDGLTGTRSQHVPIPIGTIASEGEDTANLTWEDGTLENFYSDEAGVTLSNSTDEAYAGTHTLRCEVSTSAAVKMDIKIDVGPIISPGAKVDFRVWIPSGAPISFVQPYVMPHTSNWSTTRWYGAYKDYSSLTKNAWNEFSLTLATDVDTTWPQQIGVQVDMTSAANFTFYIDTIDWPDGAATPRASFAYSPSRPNPGQTVSFDAVNSPDIFMRSSGPGGSIVSYSWDFGDGTTGSGETATHAYSSADNYAVTLTVTDSNGLINSLTRVIWCGQSEPFAPPLRVVGTDIVDADGRVVVPRGVAVIDSMEYTREDFEYLKEEWKVNMIRLPFITDRWYYTTPAGREAYLSVYDNYLDWCNDLGIYVSLDGWHEGGQGNELVEWDNIKDAWHILAQRYRDRTNIIWEIFNEPNKTTWSQWASMAENLIDIILSYDPVVKAFVVPGVTWAQEFDVSNRPINRENVIYSVHPYPQAYSHSWTYNTWDSKFGYIAQEGYGPVMNTEYGYPLFNWGDRTGYGEPILQYQENRNFGWLAWIWGGWGGPTRDPNSDRSDCWQLWWEYFNGVWKPS